MEIKIDDVLEATGGRVLGLNGTAAIHRVSTDTRTIEKGDIFFALGGARFDGHDFIKEAIEKGAGHVVVSKSRPPGLSFGKKANFILVSDTLKAFGDLARHYRRKFKIPAIAVTGSSGKTTVKEMLAHVLSRRLRVLKNRGTENNLIGVPKTLFGLEPSHEVIVLEIGTNRPGEIERLSSLFFPRVGVVTAVGHAHLEGLESLEGVKAEKMQILNHLERGGVLVLNGEDPALGDIRSGAHRVFRAGFSKAGNDLAAERIRCGETGTSFFADQEFFEIPLIGRHNVLNALLVILTARTLGFSPAQIRQGLAQFQPPAGRLELKTMEGIRFMDDTYNSNPDSFRAALRTLKEFKASGRKGVVCGDMLELGGRSAEFHRELGREIAELSFDFVIAAGPQCRLLADEAVKKGFDAGRIHAVKDSVEAAELCRRIAAEGDLVLVKGSRGMRMEKVFECFITSSTP